MAEIVNLRLVRKRTARAHSEQIAAGNRAVFGTPKSERQRLRVEAERARRLLDGAKRDDPSTSAPPQIISEDGE